MGASSPARRILIEWAILTLLAVFCLSWAIQQRMFLRADNLLYDQFTRQFERPARDDVIIVGIDDESIGRLGRWPWTRDIHALLLDGLAKAEPAAIVFDVLFVDPSSEDDRLAAAMAKARPILPLYMEVPGKDGESVTIIPPVEPIRSAAGAIGHVNLSPDVDGVVRRAHLAEGSVTRQWPHVATLAACQSKKLNCQLPATGSENGGLARAGEYLIPFAGGPQHFRTVPYAEVLAGSVPAAFFKDRIVMVGATATGLRDSYATPLGKRGALMSGVEVNANIALGLLNGTTLREASLRLQAVAAAIPLLLLLIGFLVARPRVNLLLGLLLASASLFTSMFLFRYAGLWLSPIPALAALLVIYPFWGWRRLAATSAYMREEMERFRTDPAMVTLDRRRAGEPIESEIDLLRRTIADARELQHFVTDTLQGLPDASLVIEPDGRVRLMNIRARKLLDGLEGMHFSTIVGRLGAKTDDDAAPDRPGHGMLPAEISGPGDRIYSTLWSPVRGASAEIMCWVLRLADITDLKTAQRAREEALQLLTHDMRSPQASIIAALSQSEGRIDRPLANRIEGYARRTLELADGFVQLARADAQDLRLETLNICDLMVEAVDEFWPLSRARNIQVVSRGEEELLVRGDRGLLSRALFNLVSNAIKYGPTGSIVRCSVIRRRGDAIFQIKDQGVGICDEERKNLFKPFQRGGTNAEGVGLGLAFVQSVAKRHDGSVRYRYQGGSCFEFAVPLACPDAQTESEDTAASRGSVGITAAASNGA